MIIPSIDIMDGQAVQLIGGKERALEAGDPLKILEKFSLAGEVAVIDLDAALGKGSNAQIIREMVKRAPCRVGGGIRDTKTAIQWLDAGASKIILGTRAVPEVLRELPKERVIAALDAVHGEVVVKGWQERTGTSIEDKLAELNSMVGGFLITFVEREGRLQGIDLDKAKDLVSRAGSAKVTIAGGVTTPTDIANLDSIKADAQVGMALYTGKFSLAEGIAASLHSDRADGLWPTVICDESGLALGLAWSDMESLETAVERGLGAYHSRTRGLWVKGESSGNTQRLLKIDQDCDRDALRFTVRQEGTGFCHLNTWTCWGEDQGFSSLGRLIQARVKDAPAGSYTKRLLNDADLLSAKIMEEAKELVEANNAAEVTHEAADLLYFTLVAMANKGVSIPDIAAELNRRSLTVTRRPGNKKENN